METIYILTLAARHKLVKVNIAGNRYFDTTTIRERMYLMPASWQCRQGRYSESYRRRDEEAIANLYQENGFRDVKVTSTTADDYQGKTGQIAVSIQIIEGPQWSVSKLSLEGVQQLDQQSILAG